MTYQTALERAFELARSGKCTSVQDIRTQLKSEGFSDAQIWGPTLTRQLRVLCVAAEKEATPEPG